MRKLYRSRRDSKLFGLCGGLAEYMNVDATLLRLVVVITTFFSGGTVIPIYIIACLVIPKEPILNVPPYYGMQTGMGMNMNGMGGTYGSAGMNTQAGQSYQANTNGSGQNPHHIDEMMKDIEKKAMWKEIEELRARVAKYEKGE